MKTNFTSVIVAWRSIPGSDGNIALSGYRIKYAKSDSGDYASIETKSNQTQVELTNLEENTEYDIRVAGLFEDGMREGLYSDKIAAKTLKQSSKFTLNFFCVL